MKNCYSILNVEKNATTEEISKAYLSLALTCHPDKAPDNLSEEQKKQFEDNWHKIKNAYEILSDPIKRGTYDSVSNSGYNELANNPDRQYVTKQMPHEFCDDNNKFNKKKFNEVFNQSRTDNTVDIDDTLQKMKTHEIQDAIAKREQDNYVIKKQTKLINDISRFNFLFEKIKNNEGGASTDLAEYIPDNTFSYKNTLVDCNEELTNGFVFNNTSMEDLIEGNIYDNIDNIEVTENDIINHEKQKADQMRKLSSLEIQRLLDQRMEETKILTHLSHDDYIIEQTEVEREFKDVFIPVEVEELESKTSKETRNKKKLVFDNNMSFEEKKKMLISRINDIKNKTPPVSPLILNSPKYKSEEGHIEG